MKPNPYCRILGVMFSLVYFAVNGVWAYSNETSFWKERRRALGEKKHPSFGWLASLPMGPNKAISSVSRGESPAEMFRTGVPPSLAKSLPPFFVRENANLLGALSSAEGSVRRVRLPPSGASTKIILHVLDIHQNLEAQTRISTLVSSVNRRHAVDLVALEGAFGPLDFSRYRAFPQRELIQEVAGAFLETGDISGPIHSALAGDPTPPNFVGVDDPVHYRANVDAYRAAAPLQVSWRQRLADDQIRIEAQKIKVFSSTLRAFDQTVQGYRAGRISLGEYLSALATPPQTVPKSIVDFLAAWKQEKSLDFDRAEQDRRALVEQLASRLTPEALRSLAISAAACRSGALSYAEFYVDLGRLCEKAGIPLKNYSALSEYIRYVLASDRILPDLLFRDMRDAEERAFARLARNEDEQRLVAESRHVYLQGKLVDLSLTPEEWGDYSEFHSPSVNAPSGDLAPFENFYREAQIRDASMTENILGAMEKGNTKTALLVTGGFHSTGMEDRFLKAGVTVVSFTPRIDEIDTLQGAEYLNVFTREKTPLERLFQGRTLFVPPEVYSTFVANILIPLTAAVTAAVNKVGANGQEMTEISAAVIAALSPSAEISLNVAIEDSNNGGGTVTISSSKDEVKSTIPNKREENISAATVINQLKKGRSTNAFEWPRWIAIVFSFFLQNPAPAQEQTEPTQPQPSVVQAVTNQETPPPTWVIPPDRTRELVRLLKARGDPASDPTLPQRTDEAIDAEIQKIVRGDPDILLRVFSPTGDSNLWRGWWDEYKSLIERTLGSTRKDVAKAVPGQVVSPYLLAVIGRNSDGPVLDSKEKFQAIARDLIALNTLLQNGKTLTERHIARQLIESGVRELKSAEFNSEPDDIVNALNPLAFSTDPWISLFAGIERFRAEFGESFLNERNYRDAMSEIERLQAKIFGIARNPPPEILLMYAGSRRISYLYNNFQRELSRVSSFVSGSPEGTIRDGDTEWMERIVAAQADIVQRALKNGVLSAEDAAHLTFDIFGSKNLGGESANQLLSPLIAEHSRLVRQTIADIKMNPALSRTGGPLEDVVADVLDVQVRIGEIMDLVSERPAGVNLSPEDIAHLKQMVSSFVNLLPGVADKAVSSSEDDARSGLIGIVSNSSGIILNLFSLKGVTESEFLGMIDQFLSALKILDPDADIEQLRSDILAKAPTPQGWADPIQPGPEQPAGAISGVGDARENLILRLDAYLQTLRNQFDSPGRPLDMSGTLSTLRRMLEESVSEIRPYLNSEVFVGSLTPSEAYAIIAVGGESLPAKTRQQLIKVVLKGLSGSAESATIAGTRIPDIRNLILEETSLFKLFMGQVKKDKQLERALSNVVSDDVALRFRLKEIRRESKPPKLNSIFYLRTRDWKIGMAGVVLLEMPLLIIFGPGAPVVTLTVFSLLHVLVEANLDPERSLTDHVSSFLAHLILASPYALIGVPGDAMTVVAAAWHIAYDGVLMALDQQRLARRDMQSYGVEVPEESSYLDYLVPRPQSLAIDTIDGRLRTMARVSARIKANGIYASTWGKHVDTVAVFHQPSLENVDALAAYLKNRVHRAGERRVEHVIVPAQNNPALETAIADLQGENVTVLDHTFDGSGSLVIDTRHFVKWSNQKGSIVWVVTRSDNAVPIKGDTENSLLAMLLSLLRGALPITKANLEAIDDWAAAVLSAA